MARDSSLPTMIRPWTASPGSRIPCRGDDRLYVSLSLSSEGEPLGEERGWICVWAGHLVFASSNLCLDFPAGAIAAQEGQVTANLHQSRDIAMLINGNQVLLITISALRQSKGRTVERLLHNWRNQPAGGGQTPILLPPLIPQSEDKLKRIGKAARPYAMAIGTAVLSVAIFPEFWGLSVGAATLGMQFLKNRSKERSRLRRNLLGTAEDLAAVRESLALPLGQADAPVRNRIGLENISSP